MTDEWQDIPENDGITLGPEEALAREIAKSKALKVERLRLQDQVEQLTARNQALRDQNEALKQNRESRSGGTGEPPRQFQTMNHAPGLSVDANPQQAPALPSWVQRHAGRPRGPFLPGRWVFFLLIFNLAAIGILLLFMLQNPTP